MTISRLYRDRPPNGQQPPRLGTPPAAPEQDCSSPQTVYVPLQPPTGYTSPGIGWGNHKYSGCPFDFPNLCPGSLQNAGGNSQTSSLWNPEQPKEINSYSNDCRRAMHWISLAPYTRRVIHLDFVILHWMGYYFIGSVKHCVYKWYISGDCVGVYRSLSFL